LSSANGGMSFPEPAGTLTGSASAVAGALARTDSSVVLTCRPVNAIADTVTVG